MNNKPYLHKEKPLTQSIAEEIISAKTYTSGSSITVIAKHVGETHKKSGGFPADKDLEGIVKQALQILSYSGKANRISRDTWMIPQYSYQRIFGSGKHWVYLYYFSTDKKEAESNDKSVWRCKIGKAAKNPEDRVKAQTRGVPVPPRIALFLRTDKRSALETAIHGILTLRGRHLAKLQGKEWFLTNPEEVEKIYDFIIYEDEYEYQ